MLVDGGLEVRAKNEGKCEGSRVCRIWWDSSPTTILHAKADTLWRVPVDQRGGMYVEMV